MFTAEDKSVTYANKYFFLSFSELQNPPILLIANILLHSSKCPQIPSIFISNCDFVPYNKS